MGTRASLTAIYGKNSVGERVITGYKNAGRTESQVLAGTSPSSPLTKAKDIGNTAKSIKASQPKESTIPKPKQFGYSKSNRR